MSQFTDSLREKARELEKERSKLTKRMGEDQLRMNQLNGAIAGIDSLLRVEGIDPHPPSNEGANTPLPLLTPAHITPDTGKLVVVSSPTPGLYDVLVSSLEDGKPHSVKELLEIAKTRHVDFGTKDPLKAVTMTLLGISRSKNYMHHKGDGRYQKVRL